MTFEQSLAWITTVLAGMVASFIQERFKDTWLGNLNQKWVSAILAVVFAAIAYIVQFVLGFPLFTDIKSTADVLALIAAFFAAWGGTQIWYGVRYAENYHAPK